MNNQVIDIDLMSTVHGTATNDQGLALYIVLKKQFLNDMKVRLSLHNATPMSSSFMNSSLGALIDEFGYPKVTTLLSLIHFNRTQAENIKKYFAQYKKYISA
jgi:hypothetical protein